MNQPSPIPVRSSSPRAQILRALLYLALFLILMAPIIVPTILARLASRDHQLAPLSANINGVIKGSIVYAAEHDGHFPPHLAVLICGGRNSMQPLVDRHVHEPYQLETIPAEAAWPTIAPIIDAHSDIVYTGADLNYDRIDEKNVEKIIAAYGKPLSNFPDGREIGFADASVHYILNSDLPTVFADSNAARAKLNLPPFTLDGPPPLPPQPTSPPNSPITPTTTTP